MIILLYSTIWYLIGICSFIYWWTNDYDLEQGHLLLSFFVGVLGPIVFILGWAVHGDTITILKKRK